MQTALWLPPNADVDTNLKKTSSGETVVVCLAPNGDLAGFVSVYAPGAFIHHLYVADEFQNQGVGTQLLASLNDWLPKPWRLKCVTANRQALAFYEKTGWVKTETNTGSQGEYVVLRHYSGQMSRSPS